MEQCPACGAEVTTGARRCWECHELLQAAPSDLEPLDDTDLDADLDDLPGPDPEPVRHTSSSRTTTRGRTRNASVDADDALHTGAAPPTAVVAFVASDEVQAGTIAQLLSDCGIQNFAGSEEGDFAADGERRVHVQVLKRDLEAAQRIIADFTAEFEPGD